MKTIICLFIGLFTFHSFAQEESHADPKTIYSLTAATGVVAATGIAADIKSKQIQKTIEARKGFFMYEYNPQTIAKYYNYNQGTWVPLDQAKIVEAAKANNSMQRELHLDTWPKNPEGAKQLAIIELEEKLSGTIYKKEILEEIEALKSGKQIASMNKSYRFTISGGIGAGGTIDKLEPLYKNVKFYELELKESIAGMKKFSNRLYKLGNLSNVAAIITTGASIFEIVSSGEISNFLGVNNSSHSQNRLEGKEIPEEKKGSSNWLNVFGE